MSNAVILGLDPTQCDGIYPRTSDGRCHGCGVVGAHPRDAKSLAGLVVTLELDESDRQLVLLALAVLSLRSPGFDDALNRIACRIDNTKRQRAEMYDAFRKARSDVDGNVSKR